MPTCNRTRIAIVAIVLLVSATASVRASAQSPALQSPFLFLTLPPARPSGVVTTVDAGYGVRAFEPVAGERLEPRAGALLTLSPTVALEGQLGAAGTLDHRTRFSEHVELMMTPLRHGAFLLGTNVGLRHEYSGATVALARVVGARTTDRSVLGIDVLLEHPYVAGRDAIDIISTVGATRAVTQRLSVGVEAVGSDLEALWDSEEAEGGATVLVGPTVAIAVSDRCRLVFGGGPVLRATTSRVQTDLLNTLSPPLSAQRTGYVIRTSLRLAW